MLKTNTLKLLSLTNIFILFYKYANLLPVDVDIVWFKLVKIIFSRLFLLLNKQTAVNVAIL